MRAAQINNYGGIEVVSVNDIPQPTVSQGHLVVSIQAAGVNPVDWKIREGYMKAMAPLQFPATLGGDFAGVVNEVGEGITELSVGDEVYGSALVLGAGSGAFAEMALVTPATVAKKPSALPFSEAAALPLVGVSALQAIVETMKLASGQSILIHGGAGGIGSVAIQLAKHIGAHVIATAGTDDIEYVKGLGADEVVDYKMQQFETIVKDVDAVYDTVGGETYTKSFQVLKKGGVIVSMGEQPNQDLMTQYGVTAVLQFTQINTDRLHALTRFVEEGVVKVHIEKTFPLVQVADALAFQQEGHPKGKVVITVK